MSISFNRTSPATVWTIYTGPGNSTAVMAATPSKRRPRVRSVAYSSGDTTMLQIGQHICQVEITFASGAVKTWPDAKSPPILLTVVEGL